MRKMEWAVFGLYLFYSTKFCYDNSSIFMLTSVKSVFRNLLFSSFTGKGVSTHCMYIEAVLFCQGTRMGRLDYKCTNTTAVRGVVDQTFAAVIINA
jgi:hypothetical protein